MVGEILDYTNLTFGNLQANKLKAAFGKTNKYIKQHPRMGQIEPELENLEGEYRYVMVNKVFKVIYRIENSELAFVVAVWNCRQSIHELKNNLSIN